MLLLALTGALASACATGPGISTYRVTIPILQAKPKEATCRHLEILEPCTVLLTRDYQAIVRELKVACLALGGSPKECQAEE